MPGINIPSRSIAGTTRRSVQCHHRRHPVRLGLAPPVRSIDGRMIDSMSEDPMQLRFPRGLVIACTVFAHLFHVGGIAASPTTRDGGDTATVDAMHRHHETQHGQGDDTGGLMTPLHLAVIKHDVLTAKQLLNEGADAAAIDASGRQPVHYAARSGPELLAALLDAGASPMAADQGGTLPIWYAAAWDQPECVALLLSKTPANRLTESIKVAWSQAIASGGARVLAALHKAYGDPFAGDPPFSSLAATVEGDNAETLSFLIQCGCHLDGTDQQGRNLMHLAVLLRHPRTVRVLRQSSIDWETPDSRGRRPSDVAASLGYEEVLAAMKEPRPSTQQFRK